MTAINVLVQDEAVHLFTDGMFSHGLDRSLISKVHVIPHLQAALATRGPAIMLSLASLLLSVRPQSFDAMAAQLPDFKAMCSKLVAPWQVEILAEPFEVVLVGISRDGPAAFIIGNTDAGGVTPWEAVSIPYLLTTPQIDPADHRHLATAADPLPLMAGAMQRQASAHPAQIGGFVQQTTVTREGIATRIVRDFR